MGTFTIASQYKAPPSETIKKARNLIHHQVGVIPFLQELQVDPTDPPLFYLLSRKSDVAWPGATSLRNSGTAALTRERALAAAIGESVERYCAAIYDDSSLVLELYRDIASDALDPRTFPLGSEAEYQHLDCPLRHFSDDTPLAWVHGEILGSERRILVPACMVYLAYPYLDRTDYIFQPFSTGLACGNTLEEAILRALYEVIERDAFTITWLNRLPVPAIDLADLQGSEISALLQKLTAWGNQVQLHDITTDVQIPTILALSINTSGKSPAFTVATATRLNPEEAALKSLEELAMTRLYAKQLTRAHPTFKHSQDYRDITELDQHVLLYTQPDMLPTVTFLTSPATKRYLQDIPNHSNADIAEDIRFCLQQLHMHGLEAIVVDLTSPDIAAIGLHVVRILVPGMQPLNADHRMRYLGGRRLYEVPRVLGYTNCDTTEAQLNPYPHPFP